MVFQQLPLHQNERINSINYLSQNASRKLKINWSVTDNKNNDQIRNCIIIDEVVFGLKRLGLEYYKSNKIFAENLNQYAETNIVIYQARIELEREDYDNSIVLLKSALNRLRDCETLQFVFYPLLYILLVLNYYYKKEINLAEFYLTIFNGNIHKFRQKGIKFDSALLEKINLILRNGSLIKQQNPFLKNELRGKDQEFVNRLITLIDLNLDNEKLSVNLLSRELCISSSQLYRKINRLTNYTVVELIRIVKLDRAKIMLRENKYNVSEVADKIAYSASHFTRAFTKQYGISPKELLGTGKISFINV